MNRLPLSLLDLLACSFGGVILLFFVTIVVWEEIASESSQTSSARISEGGAFILLITTSEPGTPLFEESSEASWKIAKKNTKLQWKQDLSHNYAVFYSNIAPKDVGLSLCGVRQGISLVGKKMSGGKCVDFQIATTNGTLEFQNLEALK